MPRQSSPDSKAPQAMSSYSFNPTKRYVIAQREPWSLPEDPIELPIPKQAPGAPPTLNLLGTLMMPLLMVTGMILSQLLSKDSKLQIALIIPMAVMAIGFPISSVATYFSQKKKFTAAMQEREAAYRTVLESERARITGLMQEQRTTMQCEYPSVEECTRIAISHSKRLWWRRPMDNDYLSLRVGTGLGDTSFKVTPARVNDVNDPLPMLAVPMAEEFQKNPNLPLLINLATTGSVAIAAKTFTAAYEVARRLLLDLMVHHSPLDLNIALLADSSGAESRWGWLKWLPHTGAINSETKPRRLNYVENQIDTFLKWLSEEYTARSLQDSNLSSSGKRKGNRVSIVVFFDDCGSARQSPEVARIAECGHEVGIYLIFVGGRNWPRECRSRIDVAGSHSFNYVETYELGNKAVHFEGSLEVVSQELCDRVTRSLASLEVVGGQLSAQLPENVRLSQVINPAYLEAETIQQAWARQFRPEDLLQFPIGICANRDRLDVVTINLLPESRGGVDAYHTILIGTTGSGKSEFMKSLVMGAAVRYPPNLLNFFFLDFKGGAAFNVFESLPHVSGIVTNLKPELVIRGLESIRSEIDRRQEKFAQAGAQNIWGYNQIHNNEPMPHLVLLLDEFARGLADFDTLRETLDLLVRQGRSLGMYLILANQDTNSEVDRLLNNVGWRIALKVGKDDEIAMIDRSLMNTPGAMPIRAGQGYLRSLKGIITKFQAGYAGLPVVASKDADNEEFTISSVENNGSLSALYRHRAMVTHQLSEEHKGPTVSEEEQVIASVRSATKEMGVNCVNRIYLDPLPEVIHLHEVIEKSSVPFRFSNNTWMDKTTQSLELTIPLGYVDIPSECLQEVLEIDFLRQDGHLWIVGAPGSGKAMALTTMLLSLALTHTPEEVQFYVLEFGSGSLRLMEGLPHTGAVIRLQEKEKVQRLLTFLDGELERRSSHETMSEGSILQYAQIFVIVNNYAEMRAIYPDEAERLSRYVRDGKAAGIHLVITTNRGAELSRNISSNIARKLVLQLSNRDEYLDVIGKIVHPLFIRSEGRGYWVADRPNECQVGSTAEINIKNLVKEMDKNWMGKRPQKIDIIPSCISLEEVLKRLEGIKSKTTNRIAVGVAYDNLEIVYPDLVRELRNWLIIGPRESGKSNFLACVASNLLQSGSNSWDITAISLRRSPLAEVSGESDYFRYGGTASKALEILKELTVKLETEKEQEGKRHMVLLDDLGTAFEPGNEELANLMNTFAPMVSSRQDVHLMAAGLVDELRMRTASPIIQTLRQSRTGLVFSKDSGEVDWLGAQIPLEFRRIELPAGRGFYVSKGKPTLVQIPYFGKCSKKPD